MPLAPAVSPFAGLENAQLSFLLLSSATAVDELGNAAPVYNSQPIAAYLKIVTNTKTQNLLQANAQVEPNSIALEGWCVSPTLLPETVQEETDATAVFNRQQGLFRLVLINPPYGRDGIGAMVQAEAGTQIVGWFIPDRQADGSILPGPAPIPTPTPISTTYQTTFNQADISIVGLLGVVHSLNSYPSGIAVFDESGVEIQPDGWRNVSVNEIAVDLTSFTPIQNTWTISVTS